MVEGRSLDRAEHVRGAARSFWICERQGKASFAVLGNLGLFSYSRWRCFDSVSELASLIIEFGHCDYFLFR